MLKKILIVAVLSIASFCANSQITPDSLFSAEDLRNDLDSLRLTIEISHPDPYAFCGKEKFEKAYSDALSAVNDSMTVSDFATIISEFIGVMRDSHTSIDYGYLQELQLNNEGYYLPLSVRKAIDDNSPRGFEIVVTGEWTWGIPKGSKIISINNISIEEIYSEALKFACLEGNSTTAQESIATALVPVVCGFRFGYDEENSVCFIAPESDKMEVKLIDGLNKKSFADARKAKEKNKPSWMPELTIDEELSLAVLRVPTFAPASGKKFSKYIRRSFSDLNKYNINNLVIDIRGNGGGSSSWVEYLYSYLDPEGYNTPDNVIGMNSQLAMDRNRFFHTAFVQCIIKLFFRNDEDIASYQRISSLEYGVQDTVYFSEPTTQNKNLVFNGRCYLLMNGLTASAGVDFTNAFKSRMRGVAIGEQCLGPETGTWGNPARYELPKSKVRLTISTIRYNYDNSFSYETKAIEPDYEVGNNAGDFFHEKDTQIEFVKQLIREKK